VVVVVVVVVVVLLQMQVLVLPQYTKVNTRDTKFHIPKDPSQKRPIKRDPSKETYSCELARRQM
jgi:hypothetical protein